MTAYVRAVRAPDTTFRACGFRGCTSFASHVLHVGDQAQCFVCGQCAASALHSDPIQQSEAFRKFRNEITVEKLIKPPRIAKLVIERFKQRSQV